MVVAEEATCIQALVDPPWLSRMFPSLALSR